MDTNIINSIVQRLNIIESKIEDIEKYINIGKKKKKKMNIKLSILLNLIKIMNYIIFKQLKDRLLIYLFP